VPEVIPELTFEGLGVIPEIVEALATIGIEHPFAIQSLSIPIAIGGTDMIGQARTGTGKTLAFGISLLQRILVPTDPGYAEMPFPGLPQALVMCPTRELALQVTRDLNVASSVRKARILTVYGGVGYETQLEALGEGVDVVVGTPGRLLDLANRRSLDLSKVKVLVLDEADEMLDLGFLPDVERLISKTPKVRQTLLFSATMPAAIVALSRMHLSQPIIVRAETHDAQLTVPDTTQYVYQAHDLDKPEIIGRLLQSPVCTRTMIFTRTKRAAQRLADELVDRGFEATSIHGDLNQVAREKALKKFRDGKVDVLVATDVAARGIDITDVSHVVNYECPDSEMTYVHRIGRTGRAGAKGIAVTLVDWADVTRWRVINKALDLGIPEIEESYSNTPRLLADLEIPEGIKGRLKDAAPRPPRERPDYKDSYKDGHKDGHHKDSHHKDSHEHKKDRPAADRSRRRLRNGQPIEGAEGAAVDIALAAVGAGVDSPDVETAAGDQTKPRRRRRRSSGNRDGAAASE
jgi:superfamily II DNA/RNA helicase